jgi:endogenous inhibitor of DNA gyrase (YacG/DUF329 family)
MMDMWRQSIERTAKKQTTAQQIMESKGDSKADLEQRIRNGQAQCPTCAARQYADESTGGGVSFQAATHISAATAGVVVMNHENEHVAAADRESDPEAGVVKDSTVSLQYGKCPECGKTYVKGGVTKTTTRPASYAKSGGFSANA